MDKLGLLDASFLYAETDNTPMHVAGLQHFEVPADQREGYFDRLRAYIAERVHLIPFMTRRLKATPLGMDHPVWIPDEHFDIDRHVRRIALPGPGTQRQLEQLVARLHERPLNRQHPLWEYWLIEGLEDGSVAWYTKYHHACIDGMAGQAIIDILFSKDGGAAEIPEAPKPPLRGPGTTSLLVDAVRNAAAAPLRTLRALPEMARSGASVLRQARGGDLGAATLRAPKTRFNGAVGPYRNYAIGSLPLSEVKRLGKLRGAKVNDVFMAICAGALVRYLDAHDERPERPLIAGAPVSLRQPGDASMRNQVTMLLTSLETQRSDPLERLDAIRDSANKGKALVAATSGADLTDVTVLGLPLAFRSLAGLADRLRLGDLLPVPVNLIISNVPGPRETVYLAGARMTSHYPVSIPAHGNALNITVQSYGDRMDFSLTACLEALPDAEHLRDLMVEAFAELQTAVDGAAAAAAPRTEVLPPRAA